MSESNPLAKTTVTDTTDSSTPTSHDHIPAYALALLWSATESHRVGQVAFLPPYEPVYVGRGDKEPRKFARFGWHRPGEPLVVLPGQEFLAGDKISRLQALFEASVDGVEMKKLGRRSTYVNGKECGDTTTLQEDDRILIAKQALLLVVRRPGLLPVPPGAHELHLFGEPDAAGIVGESLRAWQLRSQLELAARFEKHVLIRGETGTGKEMAAAVVHNRSRRASGPFVSLNAASVPSSIIDSELFGIAADYPNHGTPARKGVIGDADQGTLFLDEVGDCSHETQTRLLRFLESGEYRRVGETMPRRADVRVVGATNKDDTAFRKDFRARFQMVVQLHPLRERQEDIPLLARHLLVRAALPYPERRERLFFQGPSGRLEPRVSGFFVDYLVHHRLDRNTRELGEILLDAFLTSPGDEITLPGLDPALAPPPAGPPVSGPASEKARRVAKAITKPQVLAALQRSEGNLSQAARALGLGRTAMYELLERYGIKREDPTT